VKELEKYRQVMDCESCRVALCLSCFKLFHDTIDLVQKKDSLKKVQKGVGCKCISYEENMIFVKSGNVSTMTNMNDGAYFSTSVGMKYMRIHS
jgi:hypothetical protein